MYVCIYIYMYINVHIYIYTYIYIYICKCNLKLCRSTCNGKQYDISMKTLDLSLSVYYPHDTITIYLLYITQI